ncbi:hypothetical protein IF2G_07651 [Cordyceps javanica]|nr:hypothetical protein IF2G_07651 [Cordyceps javanica]
MWLGALGAAGTEFRAQWQIDTYFDSVCLLACSDLRSWEQSCTYSTPYLALLNSKK